MSEGQFDNERTREESPRRSRSPERRPMDEDRRDDRGRGRGGPGGDNNPGNNLHISGLSNRVEEADLEEIFAKYGRITKVQVMKDPHTGDARGFAFVTYETAEEADAAIGALNAFDLKGRVINVQRARRGRARTPTPGSYHGPPKRDTRPYDSGRGYSDRRGGSYDDRRGGYDDRRSGYDDRRSYDRGYDDRRGSSYDDRRGGSRYDDGYRGSSSYGGSRYDQDRRDDYGSSSRSYAAPARDSYDDRRY